jgi:hypothetical protein
MSEADEPRSTLERHLQSILDNDLETYHATSVAELTLYEWYVTPHRIDGLPFHDFLMTESARPESPASALDPAGEAGGDKARQRFDLANYHEQRYGETAVCSYTLLISRSGATGVVVRSHNESRVLLRLEGHWRVVHVHKSPAWRAPYSPAGG